MTISKTEIIHLAALLPTITRSVWSKKTPDFNFTGFFLFFFALSVPAKFLEPCSSLSYASCSLLGLTG